jgi:Na+-driven multidrug efflux pump
MPTYRSLALFAGPALALWVTGPLMSLIDSSAVGLSGSVQALAALGPATTFVDGASYLFAFISVATTNCLATAAAKGDDEEARLVVATAIRCALRCGLGVMALMLAAAPQMMGLYVGGASGAAVVVPASRYIRIRALSMPTYVPSRPFPSFLPPSLTPLSLRPNSAFSLSRLTYTPTNQPTND